MENPFDNIVDEDNNEPIVEKPKKKIDCFRGQYSFLSNFYEAEIKVPMETDTGWEVQTFQTDEHAFQASKTRDKDGQKVIRDARTARIAKKLGRSVKLRPDWEDIKLEVMERIVRAKFEQHPNLKIKLLYTEGYELIEGNNHKDDFWGVTPEGGKNHLGKILMKIRSDIITKEGNFEEHIKSFFKDNGLEFIIDRERNYRKDIWTKAINVAKQYGSTEVIQKMIMEAEE